MTHKISSDGTTAVDPDYYWLHLNTAPRGVSIWLLTKYGKPIDGQWADQLDIVGWCPKPKIPAWMKEMM